MFILRVCHDVPCSVTSGGNPMSEAEMDLHTIGGLREEAAADGRPLKQLVSLQPEDQLTTAIRKLFHNRCSMAPVLTGPSTGARPFVLGTLLPNPCCCGSALLTFCRWRCNNGICVCECCPVLDTGHR